MVDNTCKNIEETKVNKCCETCFAWEIIEEWEEDIGFCYDLQRECLSNELCDKWRK